jgi:ABC-type transport system involved in cytochrome c biogenesis ATPase subunit
MRLLASGLTCVRGGREVFSGLGFEAVGGELMAVTGRNGSGKTSLLRLIAGLLLPAGGSLALEGGEAELTLAEQAHYVGHRDALKPALSVAAVRWPMRQRASPQWAWRMRRICLRPIFRPASGGASRSPAC